MAGFFIPGSGDTFIERYYKKLLRCSYSASGIEILPHAPPSTRKNSPTFALNLIKGPVNNTGPFAIKPMLHF
jgi:hypothetical protein